VSSNLDGAYPNTPLILEGNTLYGIASKGGNSGDGTVFAVTLPPPSLALTLSSNSVTVTWSTNANGFTLQFTTNLLSSAGWTNVPAIPVIINGWNTVSNSVSVAKMFYRLRQ
jgi:uncharacterized repeat protein (TIGR03803 family)